MTEEMRALVVERPGTARVEEISRPEPAPGEVLVEVGAAGICGSDVELLAGTRPAPYVRYPIVPGHEWAGRVAALGPGVGGLAPGDVVVAEGIRSCGVCARCAEGLTNLCTAEYAETGFTHQGACAEYVAIPARLVHRLPPGTDVDAAALLEPAACVACGLLAVGVRPGLEIAVVGAGTLGLLAVALLGVAEPARLALVGTRPDRLELGTRLGATEVCNVRETDPVEALGSEFDFVFEAVGRPSGHETALRLARRGGTVVLEGIVGAGAPTVDGDLLPLRHLRVQGIFGATRAAWIWVVERFAAGGLPTAELVTHRFALEEHEAAFAALASPDAGALKVLLRPEAP